jgi:hypothetical protein
MITHHLTPKQIQTVASFSGTIQIKWATYNQLDCVCHHMIQMLWICQLSHTRQSLKLTKKNIERKDVALNVQSKVIWPRIAWTDPVDRHMRAPQTQQMQPK